MVSVQIMWDDKADQSLGLPAYATDGAAGADLRAQFPDRGAVDLAVGARMLIPTGLRLSIPEGFEAQIRPRSGLALKHGIVLPNAPGTVDSDYRGPLGVILMNLGDRPFRIAHGDRIAQMVIAPVSQVAFNLVTSLPDSPRASGGFGSTGVG